MNLTAHFVYGFSDANRWSEVRGTQELNAETDQEIVIQLVDASLDQDHEPISGRRFCPSNAAVLSVTVNDLNGNKVFTRIATMAAPNVDTSLFRLQLLGTDAIGTGTRSLLLVLNDGGTVRRGMVHQGLRIFPYNTSC